MLIRKIYLKNHYILLKMNCTTGEQKNRASPSNLENTEPFYQAYVNGEPTDYRVNRTGTGLNAFLPVDPSKR
jgi:hypothetical protein